MHKCHNSIFQRNNRLKSLQAHILHTINNRWKESSLSTYLFSIIGYRRKYYFLFFFFFWIFAYISFFINHWKLSFNKAHNGTLYIQPLHTMCSFCGLLPFMILFYHQTIQTHWCFIYFFLILLWVHSMTFASTNGVLCLCKTIRFIGETRLVVKLFTVNISQCLVFDTNLRNFHCYCPGYM